ncbi:MAG: hypothetical protein AAGN66_07790 [Acidobacteriota bacterium]
MRSLAKLAGPDLNSNVEFNHPNLWEREEHPGWSRLVIGAREKEVPLLLDLCRDFKGPFGILYVLLASRCGHDSARYQSPKPSTFEELELFLYTFQEFLEQDGRHHFWVMSLSDEGQFIYDNHNMIYAYGDLVTYEAKLSSRGFKPGEVRIPAPHGHNYHAEFDQTEDEILSYWDWRQFPLESGDDP